MFCESLMWSYPLLKLRMFLLSLFLLPLHHFLELFWQPLLVPSLLLEQWLLGGLGPEIGDKPLANANSRHLELRLVFLSFQKYYLGFHRNCRYTA